MQLIIAEKPSLGRNIVSALELDGEVFEKHDGYQESEDYIVTWCFGHLFSLQDMDDYFDWHGEKPRNTWTMDKLPFFPRPFKFVIKPEIDKSTRKPTGKRDPGAEKQYKLIASLMKRCDSVVNAGDADREGQVIVDNVIKMSGFNKATYRLWANDQTPETINECLKHMKPNSSYENIYEEGLARTYMDWLYGINLTRYSTIRAHSLIRIGRVIVPVVQAIVERDRSIENFKPEDYYKCSSEKIYHEVPLELVSSSKYSKDEENKAQEQCDRYNESGGTVLSVKKENKEIFAPKLFSLSTLQAYLDRELNPSQVLATAQSLYEQGFISYPRTDAEYLFSGEKDKIRTILRRFPECSFKDSSRIFNDKKNSDQSHGAIIPTAKVPSGLNYMQQTVYDAVCHRFMAVFWKEPMMAARTTMTIRVCDEDFNLKGDIITQKGWSEIEAYKKGDRTLPDFSEGEHIDTAFKPVIKTTVPPKHYTVSELLSFMKNPFRKEEETDVQLGTEATRAGIIENAERSQYIILKGRSYYALEKGRFLVDTVENLHLGIDKRQSLAFAEDLIAIREGKETVEQTMEKTENAISETIENSKDQAADVYQDNQQESLGTCPMCGKGKIVSFTSKTGDVYYTCTEHNQDDPDSCKFFMAQRFKRFDDVINVTPSKMEKLLSGKTIPAKLTSKKGTKYECNVKMVINGRFVNLNPVFAEPSEEIGKCPLCGQSVRNHGNFYSCDGHKDGCTFYIGKKMRYFNNQIPMTDKRVKDLIEGKSITVKVKDKNGFEYEGEFVLKQNGRWMNLVPKGAQ